MDHYEDLLRRYLDGNCTAKETETLLAWLASDESKRLLLAILREEFRRSMATPPAVPVSLSSRIKNRLFENLRGVTKNALSLQVNCFKLLQGRAKWTSSVDGIPPYRRL